MENVLFWFVWAENANGSYWRWLDVTYRISNSKKHQRRHTSDELFEEKRKIPVSSYYLLKHTWAKLCKLKPALLCLAAWQQLHQTDFVLLNPLRGDQMLQMLTSLCMVTWMAHITCNQSVMWLGSKWVMSDGTLKWPWCDLCPVLQRTSSLCRST